MDEVIRHELKGLFYPRESENEKKHSPVYDYVCQVFVYK